MNKETQLPQYLIPEGTTIGHVHLKVSDLEQSIQFYCDVLGFSLKMRFGNSAAFVAAGKYHHHIGLNTWQSAGMPPAPNRGVGLYHAAILLPTRSDLAAMFLRLQEASIPLEGMSDHGVSEALYLNDPDNNGLEIYWDKPMEHWPITANGELEMFTKALDLKSLLAEL
jgi:catechol 2,3-dioxygenase